MNVDERELDGLDADEREICVFLAAGRDQMASAMEIARRAGGKKRFQDEPKWAIRVLLRLAEKGKVESNANGHYRLRSVRNEETSQAPPKPEAWSCRGKKILYVDDDADSREAVALFLQDAGAEVSTAQDASDALVQLYETKLDLILLALDTTSTGGPELLRLLKRSQPEVPVILHAGLKHENDAILALLAGKRP